MIFDDESRCWKSPRERARRKARFEIRQRVLHQNEGLTPQGADERQAAAKVDPEAASDTRRFYQQLVSRVVQGDRAYFSLVNIQRNLVDFSSPFSTAFLWECEEFEREEKKDDQGLEATSSDGCPVFEKNQRVLIGHLKLTSWFGPHGVRALERKCNSAGTCTVIEYACWIQRYHIVTSLLLGGINPCIRGNVLSTAVDNSFVKEEQLSWQEELEEAGREFLKTLLTHHVPLILSGYIVKRVVAMRFNLQVVMEEDSNSTSMSSTCQVCERCVPEQFRVVFVNDSACSPSCRHRMCESCLWRKIIVEIRESYDDEVNSVQCPVCLSSATRTTASRLEGESVESPSILRERSLKKYKSLPIDALELKRLKIKTQKYADHEHDMLRSSWAAAIQKQSLGYTQEVRRDKFFHYLQDVALEVVSYRFVRGCLQLGADVSLRNEYGQTGLFIAVMRGHVALAKLLLEYGSDPCTVSNGECCVMETARRSSAPEQARQEIIFLLERYQRLEQGQSVTCKGVSRQRSLAILSGSVNQPTITTLIQASENHPGAGSYVIDEALGDDLIASLVSMWDILPTDESTNKKVKTVQCSERRYYCDSERRLASYLTLAIQRKLGAVKVFEYMRFLRYSHAGTALAPHVDLARVDPNSGIRSTHTLLLYLTNCSTSGATTLLRSLFDDGSAQGNVLARVYPVEGRILIFPHNCPHEGEQVVETPKLLIRGEVALLEPP
jgi:hypothetical protein